MGGLGGGGRRAPRCLRSWLQQLRRCAADGEIHFTWKAYRELCELGLADSEALAILATLTAADYVGRVVSPPHGEHLLVFKPTVDGIPLYVKIALRRECMVVSFHEAETKRSR